MIAEGRRMPQYFVGIDVSKGRQEETRDEETRKLGTGGLLKKALSAGQVFDEVVFG